MRPAINRGTQGWGTGTGEARPPRTVTTADLMERVLDKGVVIDTFAWISIAGLRVAGIDVRVVVSTIEAYVEDADKIAMATSVESSTGARAEKGALVVEGNLDRFLRDLRLGRTSQ